MAEAALISRVGRALRTRATESGEGRFNLGDQAEVHRSPGKKDASGWARPVTVISVDAAREKVAVKYR
eukprot:1126099-Pyramimonas_sp.AAC.1